MLITQLISVDRHRNKRKVNNLKNLEANNEVFLFINVEIVQLVKLVIENPDEPILEVAQGPARTGPTTIGQTSMKIEGGRQSIDGGGGQEIEELLQELVAEELVPPLRDGLLQVVRELLPEFHCLLQPSAFFVVRALWE